MPQKSKKAAKKAKAKAKKEARRREAERDRASQAAVNRAMFEEENVVRNVLSGFEKMTKITSDDAQLAIEFGHAGSVNNVEGATLFDLVKENMEVTYNEHGWGWKDKSKKAEITDEAARYLIVRDLQNDNSIVGFAHFRFEVEGIYEVMYVYELQIKSHLQRKGLGKRMMQLLELIGMRQKMKWVMLTVFKNNTAAVNFYEKLRYEVDETSPSRCDINDDSSYEIMSKCIDAQLLQQLRAADTDAGETKASP